MVLEWLGVSSRTVMATAEQWELGCCYGNEERPRRSKWRRGMARVGAGDVKAALGRIVAWLGRAEAMRGRCRGHAARGF